MEKRENFEFCAEQNENGVYVCHEESVTLMPDRQEESGSIELESSLSFKEKKFSDVNEIFHNSYKSNYSLENNALLRTAQEQLYAMQKNIIDNMNNF